MTYKPKEIRGKEPIDIIEIGSTHSPLDSIELVYYVESKRNKNLIDITKNIAKDETTGSWIGQGNPTKLFLRSQADIDRIEIYGQNKAVIYIKTPTINLDLYNYDILYQMMMLAVGGPVLEFEYYNKIALLDFILPNKLLEKFSGPKFGIEGIRELLSLNKDEPLIGTIIKPCCGLTTDEAAKKCYEAALGGVRFIKDDEKMLSPPYCSSEEKIRKISKALKKAEDETGKKVIYAPHIVARADKIKDASMRAIDLGATGLMLNAVLGHNQEVLSILAEDPNISVPLYAHSGGRSALSTGPRRIDDLVISKILRLCGADFFQHGVFGATKGGHIASKDKELLRGHIESLQNPEYGIKNTIPVVAGGLDVCNIGINLKEHYTNDKGFIAAFLAGSNLLNHPQGPTKGAIAMIQAVDAFKKEGIISKNKLKKYSEKHNLEELLLSI